jgi:hypothetical protein
MALGSRSTSLRIGRSAIKSESVDQRSRRTSEAFAHLLTVHIDNVAGQRTYQRAGFGYTGLRVAGRTGEEYVLARPLNAAEIPVAAT